METDLIGQNVSFYNRREKADTTAPKIWYGVIRGIVLQDNNIWFLIENTEGKTLEVIDPGRFQLTMENDF